MWLSLFLSTPMWSRTLFRMSLAQPLAKVWPHRRLSICLWRPIAWAAGVRYRSMWDLASSCAIASRKWIISSDVAPKKSTTGTTTLPLLYSRRIFANGPFSSANVPWSLASRESAVFLYSLSTCFALLLTASAKDVVAKWWLWPGLKVLTSTKCFAPPRG